ncbi:hypothetical protein V7S43_007516 [Phytophthora oleae]|uniref:Uncharacterized protein n=1 Tax=Phytophthora oleae TaxID=2107226 RepID=A0ABD3FNU5_9STRA
MSKKRGLEGPQLTDRKRLRTRREDEAQSHHAPGLTRTLDFHGVWRELKAAGWTSKPPRGLDKGIGIYGQVVLPTDEAAKTFCLVRRSLAILRETL